MKANELMVGDYVMVDDIEHTHPLQVVEIFKKCGAYYSTLYWDGMPDNVNPKTLTADVDKVFPIPLTPEILKKNGFETEDDVHFSIQGQSDILELLLVEVPFDSYYFDIVRTEKTINKCNQRCYIDRYFASIDYVHQLQHALRLCGIEKEITL